MSDLRSKQKVVTVGAFSGIACAGALINTLYHHVIPILPGCETQIGRLVLALRCSAAAALVLAMGIAAVALLRFSSDAIDPTSGADGKRMFIHARYASNTLEQFVLFVVALLALSTFLDAHSARLLPALTVSFMMARVLFWVGYLRQPLLRAPGMAATAMPTMIMLLYVLYRLLRLTTLNA